MSNISNSLAGRATALGGASLCIAVAGAFWIAVGTLLATGTLERRTRLATA